MRFARPLAFALAGFLPLLAHAANADASSDPYVGTWTGTVTAPQGPAEIGFIFERTARGLAVTFHLPVMHVYRAPLGLMEEHADGLVLRPLDTQLHREGDALVGTFALGHLPIKLHRGGTLSAEPPPPEFPAGPTPLWSFDLGAPTWASPISSADGFVYVGDSAGTFHAVRTHDGSPAWTWRGSVRIDGRATIAGENIFFVDGACALVCLSRRDSALRWRAPLHDAALAGGAAPDNPTFNRRTATPLVIDDTVYVGSSDGGLYALDAGTGEKRWRADAGAAVFSGVERIGADALRFGTMKGDVLTVDRCTGRELARAHVPGAVVTTPLTVGDVTVVGSRDYQLYGLARDGRLAWQHSYWFSWVESSPQLAEGVAYVGSSDYRRVTAFDPRTGRALWATDVLGMAWGNPLIVGETLYIGTAAQAGTIIHHAGGLVALDRRTGKIKWRRAVPPPPGAAIWGYAGSLITGDHKLIAAGLDGRLIALPLE